MNKLVICSNCNKKSWVGSGINIGEIMRDIPLNEKCRCKINEFKESKEINPVIIKDEKSYDYDLIVIGGGAAGISCARRAAAHGAKVAIFDFVNPSPRGSKWGLGGTTINVGCIPKKLMREGGLLKSACLEMTNYGITTEPKFNWETLINNIQTHISALNTIYKNIFEKEGIDYFNSYARIKSDHSIEHYYNGENIEVFAYNIVIAAGLRPKYLDFPDFKKICITSDDLFSLKKSPGKTLCIGGSYISLECAGMLKQLGNDVTVLVRSRVLRKCDKQVSELLKDDMVMSGIKFIEGREIKEIKKQSDNTILVNFGDFEEIFDTVLCAIGREPLKNMNLDIHGIKTDEEGKIITVNDETSVKNIYAIGDIQSGAPELTPSAVLAGKLLADRLFARGNKQVDYSLIPITIFTPLEYGSVGYSEDDAIKKYGKENITVLTSEYIPLEWIVSNTERKAFMKIIYLKPENNKLIGFHILAPSASEMIQGIALCMKKGICKNEVEESVGVQSSVLDELMCLSRGGRAIKRFW